MPKREVIRQVNRPGLVSTMSQTNAVEGGTPQPSSGDQPSCPYAAVKWCYGPALSRARSLSSGEPAVPPRSTEPQLRAESWLKCGERGACVCSSAVRTTLSLLRISSVLTPFRMFALSCSSEDKGVHALLAGKTLSRLRGSAVCCVPFSYIML